METLIQLLPLSTPLLAVIGFVVATRMQVNNNAKELEKLQTSVTTQIAEARTHADTELSARDKAFTEYQLKQLQSTSDFRQDIRDLIHTALSETQTQMMGSVEKMVDSFSRGLAETVTLHKETKADFAMVYEQLNGLRNGMSDFQKELRRDFVSKETCEARKHEHA